MDTARPILRRGAVRLASHPYCSAFDLAAMFFYSRDTGGEHLASRLPALLPWNWPPQHAEPVAAHLSALVRVSGASSAINKSPILTVDGFAAARPTNSGRVAVLG